MFPKAGRSIDTLRSQRGNPHITSIAHNIRRNSNKKNKEEDISAEGSIIGMVTEGNRLGRGVGCVQKSQGDSTGPLGYRERLRQVH